MLSDEAAKALERWRVLHEQPRLNSREWLEYFQASKVLSPEIARLYPPGWNEPVTVEGLEKCGFTFDKEIGHIAPGEMLWRTVETSWQESTWRVGGAYVLREMQPRNMGEVWQLMDRLGIKRKDVQNAE
jgi:hypothetical protein